MNRIHELISALKMKGYEVWIEGGATSDQVSELERALDVPLPPSYIAFLNIFGALGIDDFFVSGIIDNDVIAEKGGSVYGDTMRYRSHSEFPPGYVVIGKHEDGAFCLDTTQKFADREYPVVNFEFGSIQHEKPVASSFEDWLIRFQLHGDK